MNSTSSTKDPLNGQMKKAFRGVAHHLDPVVSVSDRGLSDGIVAETERALNDHELIKVKIVGDREERGEVIKQIGKIDATEVIQIVGGVALVYRRSRDPNPALSNIYRANLL